MLLKLRRMHNIIYAEALPVHAFRALIGIGENSRLFPWLCRDPDE